MWFVRVLLTSILLLYQSVQLSAQETTRRVPYKLPQGDEVVRYQKLAQLPDNVATAVRKARCDIPEGTSDAIIIIRPDPRNSPVILVNCEGFSSRGYAFLFDSRIREPELMSFAVPSIHGGPGFAASQSPGVVSWNVDTKTLTAIWRTDMCPQIIARLTYRFDNAPWPGTAPSWSLVKGETNGEPSCEETHNWKPYWEATPWQELPMLRR